MKPGNEKRESRRFSLILAGALLLWTIVSLLRHHPLRAAILGGCALVAPALAWALPAVWMPIHRGWLRIAGWIGQAITVLLLATFFFVIVTPVGLIVRALGRSGIDLRWGKGERTSWLPKTPSQATRERYRRPF
ncbi:MAG: hypothetical protein ACE15D_13700 [Candidatus Eisenbacteria bacterium]|nr:hypothetical protein [Candidatus Eisenbacteria bacterium]